MDRSRRAVLGTCLSGMAAFFMHSRMPSAQDQTTTPPPTTRRRVPSTADNGDAPAGPSAETATKSLLEQRQKDIKKDVEKLFDLATELKTEVEKTDATAILSMAMVKKAEEIEKLAKQIRDHAKG
jgi:hypothetical protein